MRESIIVALFSALAVYLAGPCAGQSQPTSASQGTAAKKGEAKGSPGKPAASDPPQVMGGAPVDSKTYIIGAEDVLVVRVWREADLSGTFNVRPDGKISLPLVGEAQAAGITPEQLGTNIAQGLSKYMTHPEVSVAVQQVNSKKYFIIGEVQKTGAFPLLVPTTVLEALVNAGGFRDFAKTKSIVIIRGAQRFKFSYNDAIKGKRREQNILLESGDQIVVP